MQGFTFSLTKRLIADQSFCIATEFLNVSSDNRPVSLRTVGQQLVYVFAGNVFIRKGQDGNTAICGKLCHQPSADGISRQVNVDIPENMDDIVTLTDQMQTILITVPVDNSPDGSLINASCYIDNYFGIVIE